MGRAARTWHHGRCSIATKRSGATTAGRDELRTVLDSLRKGDVLMLTRIDRLARSIGDLQDIVRAVVTVTPSSIFSSNARGA